MRDSRVLMTTYPTAFLYRGGGEVELLGIYDSLKQLGVVVDLYGSNSLPLSRYDVVFHYSIVATGLELVKATKKAGKKLVLMPSVWWMNAPSEIEVGNANEFLSLADEIVFKSVSEVKNMSDYVEFDNNKVTICPWGVDLSFGAPANPRLFRDANELQDYVIWPGIIEESKNQLTAIKALSSLDIPVVFVGEYRDRKYYEACVKTAPSHFKFLPSIQPRSEMLRSAVQCCKVFLEVSLEPAGLSALEAGLAGVPVVLSRGKWSSEHFGMDAILVDPLSTDEIASAVDRAINLAPKVELSSRIRTKHGLPHSIAPLIQTFSLR